VAPPSRPTGDLSLRGPGRAGRKRTRPKALGPDRRPGRCAPRVRPAGRGENGRDAEALIQNVPPTLVGPRKERGPPSPLLAWVVHRGQLSTGDVAPALEAGVGSSVGLSSVITRRRRSDRTRPGVLGRDLRDVDSVESSADRVRVRPPGKDASLCLVVVGVRLDRMRARPDHRRREESTDSPASLFWDRPPSDSAMGVSRPRSSPSGTGQPGSPRRSSMSSPRPSRLRDQRALLPP